MNRTQRPDFMKLNYPAARPPHRSSKVWKGGSPWIMQVPVISTGHFPKPDCDLLFCHAYLTDWPDPRQDVIKQDAGYTAVLRLPLPNLAAEFSCWRELTPATRRLLTAFARLHYAYLRLDPDGEEIDGLRTFHW